MAQSHNAMLKALGEEQRLAVMKGNIGKCVDYLRGEGGQAVGDAIVGVRQNVLRAGDHRYIVRHQQQNETIFSSAITKGPYDCQHGGRRKQKTRKYTRRTKTSRRSRPGRSK